MVDFFQKVGFVSSQDCFLRPERSKIFFQARCFPPSTGFETSRTKPASRIFTQYIHTRTLNRLSLIETYLHLFFEGIMTRRSERHITMPVWQRHELKTRQLKEMLEVLSRSLSEMRQCENKSAMQSRALLQLVHVPKINLEKWIVENRNRGHPLMLSLFR